MCELAQITNKRGQFFLSVSSWLSVWNVYQPAAARSEPIQSKHITGRREENSVLEFFHPLSPFSLLYEQFADWAN